MSEIKCTYSGDCLFKTPTGSTCNLKSNLIFCKSAEQPCEKCEYVCSTEAEKSTCPYQPKPAPVKPE